MELVSETPCKNTLFYKDNLFFIDERGNSISVYSPMNQSVTKLLEVDADSFIINDDILYYTSKNGIGAYFIYENKHRAISEVAAENISFYGDYIIFTDVENDNAISMLNPVSGELFRIGNIYSDNISLYRNYIFASNKAEGNAINRIDLSKGEILRIYGDPAYNIHAVNGNVYFCDAANLWYCMTVDGAEFRRL